MTHERDTLPRRPRRRGRPPSLDREAALDATWRVIARRGLDRARYQDIAEESGVAVSTLQHAFGRLEEIIELGFRRADERDDAFLAGLPSADEATPWERIECFLTGSLAYPSASGPAASPDLESWLVWVERWRIAARDDTAAARLQASYERWWRAAQQIIEDGQRDGSFDPEPSAAELSIALNALLDGLGTSLLLRPDGGQLGEARRLLLSAARRLLGPAPATRPDTLP